MAGETLSQADVDRLVRRTQIMASAFSNMWGVFLTPSDKWVANPRTGEIQYDLGLAASLSEEAQTGVALHEIAHLRFSRDFAPDKRFVGRDRQWAAYTVNVFEDRRVELLMVVDYPGSEENFRALRASFNKPEVMKAISVGPRHMQFINGLYCVIFEQAGLATDPAAIAAIAKYRDEALQLIEADSSRAMVKGLCRADGIVDALIALRDLGVPQQRTGETSVGQKGGGPVTLPAPDGYAPVGAHEDDGEDAQRRNEDEDEGEDAGGDGGDDDERAVDDEEDDGGAQSGGELEPGDLEDGEDEDGRAPSPSGAGPGQGGMPSAADLAALPDEVKKMLDDLGAEATADESLSVPERERGRKLREHLEGSRRMTGEIGRQVEDAARLRDRIPDDDLWPVEDRGGTYDKVWDQVSGQSWVLGRQLGDVLHENRFDRWSAVGYETGGRLRPAAMARVPSGERRIFRQQTRMKNRRYAVAIATDISGSMMGRGDDNRLAHALVASVLVNEALESAQGIEFAQYAFGSHTVCLKPYHLPLERRRGKIGALPALAKMRGGPGGGTNMGRCLERVGGEMVSLYGGETWQKLLIVITDGQPGDDPEPVVRELVRRHGVMVVGIGIKTAGRMARLFPAWVAVDEGWEVPKQLVRVIRRSVQKG